MKVRLHSNQHHHHEHQEVTFQSKNSEACLSRNRKEQNFYVAGTFRFTQVLQFWILRTPNTCGCRRFVLETGFLYAQVPFKTNFLL